MSAILDFLVYSFLKVISALKGRQLGVCIATTTFYNDIEEVRAQLALKTIREAKKYGYPIVVVDGGSAAEFREKCIEFGATLVDREKPGMGPSRRQCIREAWRRAKYCEAVFWMEPEKWTIVRWLFLVIDKMIETEADIVVPSRKSLASYPPLQQLAERLGNMYFAKTTGHELDVWIGPRLIGLRALPYFLDYRGEYGDKWDSIFVPICRAIKAGLTAVGCKVDYVHPAKQTEVEEKDPFMDLRRLNQLKNLVPAFYGEMNPEFHSKAKELGLL